MGCVLRASGKDFNVDAFLRGSQLEPLTVWHVGEPRAPVSNPIGRQHQDSGMNVSVSLLNFSDLPGQIRDARSFLQDNRSEILRLKEFPGVESIQLDFPIEDRDVALQSDVFKHELIALLGDLGIDLVVSRYPAPTSGLSS